MNVLIADKFPDLQREALIEAGCEVHYDPALKDASLIDALAQRKPEVLVVRSTKVPAEAVAAYPGLSLIVRAGAGYDTIDLAAASARSIYVANCPGMNSVAVAELAFALILSLDRRIPDNVADLRAGVWNKGEYSKADGIYGKRLGIVGLGRIGRELALRAKAFGMEVGAWSRSLTEAAAGELGIQRFDSPVALAAASEVVSLHVASTAETRGIAGKAFFEALAPGAYFINTSRADTVDEQALIAAVRDKGVRAAVDVFDGEPSGKEGSVTSELFGLPGVYGTHHIGASTNQAQNAVANEVVRIVECYVTTGEVPNVVNRMSKSPARQLISVHHRNRVGVLASVLQIIKEKGVNVDTMENVLFEGGEGACANIQVETPLGEEDLAAIREASEDIYAVTGHAI